MNRRTFLLSLACCTLYGPIVEVPPVTGQRIGLLADTQMWTNEIERLFGLIRHRPVEWFIHAGDVVSIDGDIEANWIYTRGQLDSLGKPYFCVPGNHDLVYQGGNHGAGPAEPVALAKWAQYIGPLQWVRDTDYTRFIGLNYLDWSSGNQAWLAGQLATARRKVIVSHYPLGSVVDPFWQDVNAASKRLFFEAHGVSLFICGHRHHFIVSQLGSVKQVVCPAISFVAGAIPEPVLSTVEGAAEGGVTPLSYPMLGWLEIVDGPEQLAIEVFLEYGLRAWVFGA